MTSPLEPLSDQRFEQAESPRWDGRTGELLWVDLSLAQFYRGQFRHGVLVATAAYDFGHGIGCAAPLAAPEGGWVVSAGRDFWHVSQGGNISRLTDGPVLQPAFMNDGGCDPSGRFWSGTQRADRAAECSLYSLELDGTVVERLRNVTVSNGLAFDRTGTTLYYIDTLPRRSIEAFDVAADGALSGRRVLTPVAGGNPDGMTIDDDGNLWVAVWDASEVHHYSAQGVLLEVLRVPAKRPTAVTLVGRLLVVTTARVGLAQPSELDGAIFGAEVAAGGSPAYPWRGRAQEPA